MRLNATVFDLWVFRRRPHGVEFLILRTSQAKAYTIYNRRFHEIQIVSVFAVETAGAAPVQLDPQAHSEYEWLPYETALARVHFRGLKDGLRSTHDYIVGVDAPAPELPLTDAGTTCAGGERPHDTSRGNARPPIV